MADRIIKVVDGRTIAVDGAELLMPIVGQAVAARDAVRPIYGNGPPTPDIGIIGSFYRDMSDPLAPLEWFKTNAGWQGPQSLRGEPGGDASQIGLFAEIPTLTIPSSVNAISVTGTSSTGDAGNGRRFIYDADVDAAFVIANPDTSARDATGRGFREIKPTPATAFDYRAYGDGATDVSTPVIDFWDAGGGFVPDTGIANPYVVGINTPLDDMHGPGLFRRAGRFVTLPDGKVPFDVARKIMALFAQVRASNGGLALLGTSIDEGYHYAAPLGVELDWFTILRNLFAFVSKDTSAEAITNFSDPGRYGLTISGGAIYAAGPVGRAIVLQPGDYIEYTGAYAYNEVFRQTDPSNGKLAFSYNGGAPYKTVDCGVAAATDVCSFPSATASASSGTHRITCTTAPVLISALVRLNPSVTATPTFTRMAVASTSTVNIMGHIPSILKVGAGYAGGKSCFFVDHMVNEWQNGTPSQHLSVAAYKANMQTLVKAILDAGHFAVLMSGMRPDEGTFAHVESWDLYMAALRDVADQFDVPLIDLDVVDWFNKGLLLDGLHPNQAGALRRARIVLERLASLSRLSSRVYPPVVPVQAFVLPIGDETTALTSGTGKYVFRAPYPFTLTQVRASVHSASTSGNVQIDIQVNGNSILSAPIYVGSGQKTSLAAAVQPAISNAAIPDDAEISIDVVAAGTGVTGLKVGLAGTKTS